MRRLLHSACFIIGAVLVAEAPAEDAFERAAGVFERRCLSCHSQAHAKGGLSLQSAAGVTRGGDSGEVVAAGDPDASYLLDLITPHDGRAEMPKDADPLSATEREAIRDWIVQGAAWPEGRVLEEAAVRDTDWWSLQPVERPSLPTLPAAEAAWVRTPIDAFIAAKHREKGLTPSIEADRRTLIRRLSFDLLGLPPTPQEIDAFLHNPDPRAYEKLVDRLLASPQYGERWARHWLDVVHYGDTHGYDKDKLRLNAWPYRDYVIRSFNDDKPYGRFLREQVAGDVLFPGEADGVVATGFIAAGPWDFISHVEVAEEKIDGRIARSLDRDDMVRNTMETFCSVTVGCARCHNHKFDPITQQDYYNLQAVFAAVDRAERPYDVDPGLVDQRQELVAKQRELEGRKRGLDAAVRRLAGPDLQAIEQQIDVLNAAGEERPEFGYHSAIVPAQDAMKWVQVDLGEPTLLSEVTIVACHDDFNGIGAGFGFPLRYRIDGSNDAEFREGVVTLVDHTAADVPNPGVAPQRSIVNSPHSVRYLRVTATKLALRRNDYIFALAELMALTPAGNAAAGREVTSLDSIEAPVRWRKSNLTDGYYYGAARDPAAKDQLAHLGRQRQSLLERVLSPEQKLELDRTEQELQTVTAEIAALPQPRMVYAAATQFAAVGNHKSTGGAPREIRVLHRGNIGSPGELAAPAALAAIEAVRGHFPLSEGHSEGDRRAALAGWIADPANPLTWRSIVNRVWLYHFGRGLVDTPNDFGRMGQLPTHPELLDWLAADFRDNGQSLKRLHRLICNSATYRQRSGGEGEEDSGFRIEDSAEAGVALDSPPSDLDPSQSTDADNRYLWRMNRRRLEAEAIRDAVLAVSDKLDRAMYGPGFQDFVIEKPEHSPHYRYNLADPEDVRMHRRGVYRFVVRSQPQPFMTALDCADPSMQVDKRNETVTALQALALLNNRFMVSMSDHFAQRIEPLGETPRSRVAAAFRLTVGRAPTPAETEKLARYAEQHGLPNTCRVILNLNEFVFID